MASTSVDLTSDPQYQKRSPYESYDPPVESNQHPDHEFSSDNSKELHGEIAKTVEVVRDNLRAVDQRGEQMDSLQNKTDTLAVSAHGFRNGANKVRKMMWWNDMKMRLLIIGGIAIIIIIIVVSVVTSKK